MARWIPPPRDVALALGLATLGAVAAVLARTPPGPALAALLLIPIAWRCTAPTLVAVLAAAGVAGVVFATMPPVLVVLAVVATVIVAYSAAVHARQPWFGLAVMTAGMGPVVARSPQLPIPVELSPLAVLAAATAAGIAVRHTSRTAAAERAAALAAERARIARELHDVVTHRVSVMVLQAGAARAILPGRPGRAVEALRVVETGGREALEELRRLLGLLTDTGDTAPPPTLALLPDLVAGAGLPVTLTIRGTPRRYRPGWSSPRTASCRNRSPTSCATRPEAVPPSPSSTEASWTSTSSTPRRHRGRPARMDIRADTDWPG